jgi:hypothetical protein
VQLQVTEADFWACVRNGTLPPRPAAPAAFEAPGAPLDGKLVRNLIVKVGKTEKEVEGMTKEEAVACWLEWLSSGGGR